MKNRQPAWWQLFLLVPVMFGLFLLETAKPLPGVSDKIVDAGLVVLFFGAVFVWVHLNGGILEHYYIEQDGPYDFRVTVYGPEKNEQPLPMDTMPEYRVPRYDWQNVLVKEEEKWSRN